MAVGPQAIRFTVAGTTEKLVTVLQNKLRDVSGRALRNVLQNQQVKVNGKIERFATVSVKQGDVIDIAPQWHHYLSSRANRDPLSHAQNSATRQNTGADAPQSAIPTLFEDDEIMVVNKPSPWVCSPAACLQRFGKTANLVHRLDKQTTGALMLAKSRASRDHHMQLFADRFVEKQYLAIVDGVPKQRQGVRETYFRRKLQAGRGFQAGQTFWYSASTVSGVDRDNQVQQSNKGLYAKTAWKVLASGKDASLLLCQPCTGRTHQIRVHLAELSHPILIDRQYAKHFRSTCFATRPLLHSFQLSVDTLVVRAPLPTDMIEAMSSLGIDFDIHSLDPTLPTSSTINQ